MDSRNSSSYRGRWSSAPSAYLPPVYSSPQSKYSSPSTIYTPPPVINILPIGVSYSSRTLAMRNAPSPPSPRRRMLDDLSESSSGASYSTGRSFRSNRTSNSTDRNIISPTISQSSKLTKRIDNFLRTSDQTRRVHTSRYRGDPDSPELSLSLSRRAQRSTSAASIAVKADKHLETLATSKKVTRTGGSTSESLDNLDSDSDESLDLVSDDTSADLSKVKLYLLIFTHLIINCT